MKAARSILALSFLLLPQAAHAQHVPLWLAVAALSPIFVLVLVVILGLLVRSWRVGARHTAFVLLWIILFVIVVRTIENDYIIWTPIVLYAAHAILILVLIVANIVNRMRAGSRGS